jgi:hypothetical protein
MRSVFSGCLPVSVLGVDGEGRAGAAPETAPLLCVPPRSRGVLLRQRESVPPCRGGATPSLDHRNASVHMVDATFGMRTGQAQLCGQKPATFAELETL